MLAQIDERVDARCMAETMDKQGCAVGINDMPAPFRVVDLDHPQAPVGRTARKCDYLFVAADSSRPGLFVAPLELKGSGLRPATVVPQLQAGARVAETITAGISPVEFRPVAVHGRKCTVKRFKSCGRGEYGSARDATGSSRCGVAIVYPQYWRAVEGGPGAAESVAGNTRRRRPDAGYSLTSRVSLAGRAWTGLQWRRR